MGSTLIDLVKAVQGLIVMSETLDLMYNALNNGIVPLNWNNMFILPSNRLQLGSQIWLKELNLWEVAI